jgi:hypothetical protein
MRDRRVRLVFLGLILAFPLMMIGVAPAASGRTSGGVASEGWPLLSVELLLVGGLVFAGRQRVRLLAGAATAPRSALHHSRRRAESRTAVPMTKTV